jgi:hypothetical protein
MEKKRESQRRAASLTAMDDGLRGAEVPPDPLGKLPRAVVGGRRGKGTTKTTTTEGKGGRG